MAGKNPAFAILGFTWADFAGSREREFQIPEKPAENASKFDGLFPCGSALQLQAALAAQREARREARRKAAERQASAEAVLP